MRLVDRYLTRSFLAPFLYCLALFSALFFILDIFNHLDEYIKNSVAIRIIATYYFYLYPSIVVQILPVAALVALLFSLGNLNKNNELVAMRASGVSPFHILSPFLFLGILISFWTFLFNERIVPASTITSTAVMDGLILKGKHKMEERAIKNVTLLGQNNRMIYAREFEVLSQTLHDIVILEDDREQGIKSKLIAKKARHVGGSWIFEDVMEYQMDDQAEILGEPVFYPTFELEMPERPQDFLKEASQVEFMNARELREYIDRLGGSSRKLLRNLRVDLHQKIAFPFITFIVMLIGSPLAMRTDRGHAMLGIGTSLVIVMAYYATNSVCLALGKGGFLAPALAAWASNLLFGCIGLILIQKRS